MSSVCVGVDAGGSRTVAASALPGEEGAARTFVGDPANLQVHGVERAADAIAQAVEGVLGDERAAAIAVGAAGAGREETSSALLAALMRRFPGVRVAVTDDAHIALRGAIAAGDGIVLVAGTGSIAYAEIGAQRVRAGGYGYLLGDEGSGYALGSAAVRLLLRAYEGRAPREAMLEAVASQIGASNAREVVERIYASHAPVASIAACAPLVLFHAAAGERGAGKIVQAAALDLFDLLKTVLGLVEGRALPLAFAGGLLRENSMLTYLLETRIASEFPYLRIVKGGGEPYLGALAEARALLS